MPGPIDELRRKIMQLEIEEQALNKETDEASREKLEGIRAEKTELQRQERSLHLTSDTLTR
jgi:ATP-dependent Clp protease ATP-binding subunit ClpB